MFPAVKKKKVKTLIINSVQEFELNNNNSNNKSKHFKANFQVLVAIYYFPLGNPSGLKRKDKKSK